MRIAELKLPSALGGCTTTKDKLRSKHKQVMNINAVVTAFLFVTFTGFSHLQDSVNDWMQITLLSKFLAEQLYSSSNRIGLS